MGYYKVNYDKLFPYAPYLNLRIGVEYIVEDGQDPKECLSMCSKVVEDFYKESNPNIPQCDEDLTISVEPISPIESIKKDIQDCDSITNLESYRLIVKNNPELKEIYDLKLKTFSNG
jgi:hypothetical protein